VRPIGAGSDLKTTENRPKEGLNSKLRNQFQSIPLTLMMGAFLQTNISAALLRAVEFATKGEAV
jgi:hypothetical protein